MSDAPIPTTTSKSGAFMTVTSATQFDEQAVFEGYILSSLCQVKEYHEFVYINVSRSWGEVALRLIDEKIPSWNSELAYVALEFKCGPYSGSRKEPDFFFQVNDHILPTLAIESGWSESKEQLRNDMNLLLMGGNGSVKIFIIVKWTKLQGARVSGTVELFMRYQNGMPRLEQSEIVFPRPTTARGQRIGNRRNDLFEAALLAGRNGNDILYLDVERLRDHATRALCFMNLTSA
ncbi:hypothetical protein MPDQ_000970 [Monascus purpureus]|uniref:Uncharacterized protein n=1 Tax=Monascus purpureus TaxID=5098 RepID=A0A507QNM9_MONPU|nr:hypothetical protein MPDQ_000970 [Monascus purpureus]